MMLNIYKLTEGKQEYLVSGFLIEKSTEKGESGTYYKVPVVNGDYAGAEVKLRAYIHADNNTTRIERSPTESVVLYKTLAI